MQLLNTELAQKFLMLLVDVFSGTGILVNTPSDYSNVVSNAKISSERTFLLLSPAAENKNSEDLQQNLAPYWYKLNALQPNIDHADDLPHGTCAL